MNLEIVGGHQYENYPLKFTFSRKKHYQVNWYITNQSEANIFLMDEY